VNSKEWYNRPLRILQTVLREIDAVDYDIGGVISYMTEARCNALVINGGGIFDFFQNTLPMANINPYIGDRDILAEASQACRKAGIRVIVRVDFRGVDEERYKTHPDWFGRNSDGSPIMTRQTSLELYAPCYNSHYRNEHAAAFISHLFENYPIDGIWHNAVLCRDVCYCERCRESFKAETGAEIPIEGTSGAEEMEAYWSWKSRCADHNLERLRQTVKSFGSDKAYTAEVFDMFDVQDPKRSGIDLYQANKFFDFLVSVAFLTKNRDVVEYADLNYPCNLVRFLKALDSRKQPVVLFGGNGTSHRYIMDPPLDSKVWMWQAVSLGSGFWNCHFNGQHPRATSDRRNAFLAKEVYSYIEKNSDVLEGQMPIDDVSVFYSKNTKDHFGSDETSTDAYNTAVAGATTVLLENHIQYGFLTDESFGPQALESCNLLMLPNVACLSDQECARIREYVAAGGKLIATFETSLYDEKGMQRKDFGLSDLFACTYTGQTIDTNKDCYQSLADARDHALLEGITDTDMLINTGRTALCDLNPGSDSTVICWHVPKIINQPPEKAWREKVPSSHPTIVASRFGKGEVVYFANQSARESYVKGHEDLRYTLRNAILYLLGDKRTLKTTAPESVNVVLTRDEAGRYLLSLVNISGGFHRPLRNIISVADISVTLRLPDSGRFSHRVLRGTSKITLQKGSEKDSVTVQIERLEDFVGILLHKD
jgi:hypothetical protein